MEDKFIDNTRQHTTTTDNNRQQSTGIKIMSSYEVEGTYGGGRTATTIFVVEGNGGYWYAAMGSTNVNCTTEDIQDGVNIEELDDVDMFTAMNEIESLEDLEKEVEDV